MSYCKNKHRDPATAGGYSVAGAGLNPHFSAISHMASTWALNIRGPVYLGEGPDGRSIHALPTEIASAGGREAYFNTFYNLRLCAIAYNSTPANGLSMNRVVNGVITESLRLDLFEIIEHTDLFYRISKSLRGNAQVLYNLFAPNYKSPYTDRLNMRIGLEYKIPRKKPVEK